MAQALLVLGEQCSELVSPGLCVWRCDEWLPGITALRRTLLSVLSCVDLRQVCGSASGLPEEVTSAAISALCDEVRRETWRSLPAATLCAAWLVCECESGEVLAGRLPRLLPALLLLLDDCESHHQAAALAAVKHLLDHVSVALLRRGGTEAVLADAVNRLVSAALHEPSWLAALPLSLRLCVLVDGRGGVQVRRHVKQFVCGAGCESGAPRRLASVNHVAALSDVLGEGVVCWLRPLLELLTQYVEVASLPNPADWSFPGAILGALQQLAVCCGARMERHGDLLHQLLLRLMYDVSLSKIPPDGVLEQLAQLVKLLNTSGDWLVMEWRMLIDRAEEEQLPEAFTQVLIRMVGR